MSFCIIKRDGNKNNKTINEIYNYLNKEEVKNIGFDNKSKSYFINNKNDKKPGLIRTLKRKYYPRYKRKSRRKTKTKKKGSGVKIGKQTENQLFNIIKNYNNNKTKKIKLNQYARGVVKFWKKYKHELVASQLPVHIKELNCITQADFFTIKKNKLYMWELKTGYPVGAYSKQGYLSYPFNKEPSHIYNHWELQKHYTHLGFKARGLNIHKSYILNVYREEKNNKNGKKTLKTTVKIRETPSWLKNVKFINKKQNNE